MKIEKKLVSYQQTNSFSKLVVDYLSEENELKDFVEEFPSMASIQHQILRKQSQSIDRELLSNILSTQYQSLKLHELVQQNIQWLKDGNTFTICTAHQPIIFTGPLYFIYKIIHAIKLAKVCSSHFSSFRFVPVFYMGSEDNDADEIGVFHVDQKTFSWSTTQTGACGRMHTDELKNIVVEIGKLLNETIPDEVFIANLFAQAYNGINTLSFATRMIVNALFGKYGLLVIDGDDIDLKRTFSSVIKDELLNQSSVQIVKQTIESFPVQYKVQANPRDVNLFYLKDNLRERIEYEVGEWQVVNTDIRFNREELLQELEIHPDRFSPNVILRPLYQETILPNVAFVGGGGELAYWLELKKLFQYHQITYPILFLRNSVLWISPKTIELIHKTGLPLEAFFDTQEKIFSQYLKHKGQTLPLFQLQDELQTTYSKIVELSKTISPELAKSMLAQQAKATRIEQRIQQKFKAHLKRKEDVLFNRIGNIKAHFSPQGNLQERYENFLLILKMVGMEMFDILLEQQDAFGTEFLILSMIHENEDSTTNHVV